MRKLSILLMIIQILYGMDKEKKEFVVQYIQKMANNNQGEKGCVVNFTSLNGLLHSISTIKGGDLAGKTRFKYSNLNSTGYSLANAVSSGSFLLDMLLKQDARVVKSKIIRAIIVDNGYPSSLDNSKKNDLLLNFENNIFKYLFKEENQSQYILKGGYLSVEDQKAWEEIKSNSICEGRIKNQLNALFGLEECDSLEKCSFSEIIMNGLKSNMDVKVSSEEGEVVIFRPEEYIIGYEKIANLNLFLVGLYDAPYMCSYGDPKSTYWQFFKKYEIPHKLEIIVDNNGEQRPVGIIYGLEESVDILMKVAVVLKDKKNKNNDSNEGSK